MNFMAFNLTTNKMVYVNLDKVLTITRQPNATGKTSIIFINFGDGNFIEVQDNEFNIGRLAHADIILGK